MCSRGVIFSLVSHICKQDGELQSFPCAISYGNGIRFSLGLDAQGDANDVQDCRTRQED